MAHLLFRLPVQLRLGHRALDSLFVDVAKDRAAATAAVADVAHPLQNVAHGVYQASFLGLVEDGHRLLLRDVARPGRPLT